MVQDIIIRAEFLIEDLNKSILKGEGFHPLIFKAYQNLVENDIEYDDLIPYNFNNKEDLKKCIDMGMDAEDIAYLVNQYRDNKEKTHFFYYNNTNNSYTCHILTKQEVENVISKHIESIAYNVLRFPYRDVYGELYREFVVPMIDNQK